MKTYYKVTSNDLKSCSTIVYDIPDKYKVQYKMNEFVSGPNNTPLFVFDSIRHVRIFMYTVPCRHPRIFECEAVRPRRIKYLSFLDDTTRFLNFMKNKERKKKLFINDWDILIPPQGTFGVSAVKLIREVIRERN